MDKVLLSDLKKKILIRSALISLSSLDEILGLNDALSSDEILLELVKKALREFELTNPLILDMKVNRHQMCTCEGRGLDGYYEIKNNFTLFLEGKIGEDQIVLVPNTIPLWRIGSVSYPTPGNYQYFSDYIRPYVFMGDVPSIDQFYIRGICSRPIIPDFLSDKTFNTESKKSAIYYLNVEEGALGVYFMDLVMVHILDFIRQLKASLQLPNASVDVLGNVDSAYQELRSRCDQFSQQSGWYGKLLV